MVVVCGIAVSRDTAVAWDDWTVWVGDPTYVGLGGRAAMTISPLTTYYLLLTTYYLLLTIYDSLLTAYCLLLTADYLLLTTSNHSLLTVYYLLLTI